MTMGAPLRPRAWQVALCLALGAMHSASAQQPLSVPAASAPQPRYVQGSWVNVREAPQPDARVVAQLPANTALQWQPPANNNWCRVQWTGAAVAGAPKVSQGTQQGFQQGYVACQLLTEQPLTLAQASTDPARAFWVAPSPNRWRAYGNALPKPVALQMPSLVKTHTGDMPVRYPVRAEFEAAKQLMRVGVLLQPANEIARGQPVNPLRDITIEHPLQTQPQLRAIAPSYFRSHDSVALLHETDADGVAAVAQSRVSVTVTTAEPPVARFNRHMGPEVEYVTGFWDVGAAQMTFAPALTVYAITQQGLVGAQTVRQRAWDISNEAHYCGATYDGRSFEDPSADADTAAVRGYAQLTDTAQVLARMVLPGKLSPNAVQVRAQRYATSWVRPAQPPEQPQPMTVKTAVVVYEIDLDRDGVADVLRIELPSPGSMSGDPVFIYRWYLNIQGQWFRAGRWIDEECT